MTTTSLARDPEIDALCPPRRKNDDRLYAEWVLGVITTLPASRDAHVTKADQNAWDAWQAEGRKIVAWMNPEAQAAAPAITAKSLDLFLAYANDANNWSGNPLVGGNVGGLKEDRGNLTQLKQAGLLTTFRSDGETFIEFTEAGKVLAAEHGVQI